MTSTVTVVARIRAAKGKGDALAALLVEQCAVGAQGRAAAASPIACTGRRKIPELFLFYETYADDAAFEVHRTAPHLAAYRQRRDAEGLVEGSVEVDLFRALSD